MECNYLLENKTKIFWKMIIGLKIIHLEGEMPNVARLYNFKWMVHMGDVFFIAWKEYDHLQLGG